MTQKQVKEHLKAIGYTEDMVNRFLFEVEAINNHVELTKFNDEQRQEIVEVQNLIIEDINKNIDKLQDFNMVDNSSERSRENILKFSENMGLPLGEKQLNSISSTMIKKSEILLNNSNQNLDLLLSKFSNQGGEFNLNSNLINNFKTNFNNYYGDYAIKNSMTNHESISRNSNNHSLMKSLNPNPIEIISSIENASSFNSLLEILGNGDSGLNKNLIGLGFKPEGFKSSKSPFEIAERLSDVYDNDYFLGMDKKSGLNMPGMGYGASYSTGIGFHDVSISTSKETLADDEFARQIEIMPSKPSNKTLQTLIETSEIYVESLENRWDKTIKEGVVKDRDTSIDLLEKVSLANLVILESSNRMNQQYSREMLKQENLRKEEVQEPKTKIALTGVGLATMLLSDDSKGLTKLQALMEEKEDKKEKHNSSLEKKDSKKESLLEEIKDLKEEFREKQKLGAAMAISFFSGSPIAISTIFSNSDSINSLRSMEKGKDESGTDIQGKNIGNIMDQINRYGSEDDQKNAATIVSAGYDSKNGWSEETVDQLMHITGTSDNIKAIAKGSIGTKDDTAITNALVEQIGAFESKEMDIEIEEIVNEEILKEEKRMEVKEIEEKEKAITNTELKF